MSLMMPKKVKYRKSFKGRRVRTTWKGNELNFGSHGLKSLSARWVTSRQLEAARRAIIRYLKKGGKVWVRVFPDKPVTSKGNEVPMGGGKGLVDHYVFSVTPGRVLFEVDGLKDEAAVSALRKAGDKLPVRTKIIKR